MNHSIHYLKHALLGYCLILLCFTTPALSATSKDELAKRFIDRTGNDALAIISNTALNDRVKTDKLSQLFEKSVDIKWIGKFVMGHYWRQLNDEQKKQYTDVFRRYLVSLYVPKFKQYNNKGYTILKTIKTQEDEYTVMTTLTLADGTDISVDYKVHFLNATSLQIFDVVAEGVSLLNTQRSEFSSILSRNTPEFLINALEQKTTTSYASK